ncbi:MAG: hypothetical protein AB7J13_16800, partial [Pyrinomonadaceae bacterium]
MARKALSPENLSAGQFYGSVPRKRVLSSSILSEVLHSEAVEVPEHSHELAYFTLLVGGDYSERFGSRQNHIEPMSVIWHRSGISHKDRIGESGARCFTIEIQKKGMDRHRDFAPIPLDLTEHRSDLVWLATRLFCEFRTWDECSELVAEGLTLEMLGYMNRSRTTSEGSNPRWLERVKDRLEEEFRKNLGADDLAATAGVHPVYLASVFRKFHGQTIGEYVHRLR